FSSGQDAKDSTREIAQAVQGGLGMPDRDYYTKTDEASKKLRDQYVDHVAKMLTFLGEPTGTASDQAKKILALETKLAEASRKRVIASTDDAIGEALGKLYVAFDFPPQAKARALELVNNLKEALSDRIKTLEWMDEPTKQEALKKLAAMRVKIGYPDKWLDYSLLQIDRGPYILNAMRAAQFEADRDIKKIGKPVDRTDWGMTPPTVNAYY